MSARSKDIEQSWNTFSETDWHTGIILSHRELCPNFNRYIRHAKRLRTSGLGDLWGKHKFSLRKDVWESLGI